MRVPIILIASALIGLSGIGCGKKKEPQTTAEPGALAAVAVPNADDQLALDAAKKLTQQFSSSLQGQLTAAIQEGGPAKAMHICNTTASGYEKSLEGQGWSIKRVTQKFRNPDNRADTLESQILAAFVRDTTRKYQNSCSVTGGLKRYVYYEPIYVSQVCLNCHGDPGTMDPKIAGAIANRYPTDQAVGYKVGDLLGMYEVNAEWPTAKIKAEELIK